MGRFPTARSSSTIRPRRSHALIAGALLATIVAVDARSQGAPGAAPAASTPAAAQPANPEPTLPPKPVLGGEVSGIGGDAAPPRMGPPAGGPCCGSAPGSAMNPPPQSMSAPQAMAPPPAAPRSLGVPLDLVLVVAVIAFLLGWFTRRPPKLT